MAVTGTIVQRGGEFRVRDDDLGVVQREYDVESLATDILDRAESELEVADYDD